MKTIKVNRSEIPAGWTDEHVRVLEHGHERGVLTTAFNGRKRMNEVLGFASRHEVGVSVFGGLTFVDMHGRHGNGPVRFEMVG